MDGYGFFAKGLEYGSSKAVGAELGMFMTTKQAIDGKRAALERFVWVYLAKEEELGKSPAAFAGAYAQLTGMAPEVAAQAAKIIKLGEVISPDQIKRQAKGFAELGVIQKDVSEEIDAHWDGSFVDKALGK
jgi:sulfonate transport system substrate-binding protein